nr:hypothetical protein [Gammaproteobacteria bacterium]
PDAKKALAAFEKSLWLCAAPDFTIVEVAHYSQRGRPRQGQTPKVIIYRIEGALASRPEQRTTRPSRIRRESRDQNPTLRWVSQLFVGIYLLLIQEVQAFVRNLNDLHGQVLGVLGPPYEALYS